jgi:exosortase N
MFLRHITIPLANFKRHHLLLVALIGISTVSLYDYVLRDLVPLALGMIAILSTSIRKKVHNNYRFALAALIVWVLTLLVPVKTLLFFMCMFSLFYLLEAFYASVSVLSVAALVVCSPVFPYVINVFSFPIRLQLTSWVSGIFNFLQTDIAAKGNVIFHKGYEFAIDPACMGLHMLSISVLSGILLVGLLQKKSGKYLSWKISLVFLFCLFLFNVIANLIRIVLLVQFTIMPGTIMHDVTGLVCLLLYVCIPAALLAKMLVFKWGKAVGKIEVTLQKPNSFLSVILLGAILIASIVVSIKDTYAQFTNIGKQQISGYNSTVFMPGVLKLENQNALVYVKFIRGFYDTEHNPSICWKGSGYEFRNIHKQKFGNHKVMAATLTKEKDLLYTAWWFDNGARNTTDQLNWRWDMITGGNNYAVINVTATTEQSLHKEMMQLFEGKTLLHLFNNGEDAQHQTINK